MALPVPTISSAKVALNPDPLTRFTASAPATPTKLSPEIETLFNPSYTLFAATTDPIDNDFFVMVKLIVWVIFEPGYRKAFTV